MNSVGDSYLLVTEPHLSSGVPRDIHPAEKQPLVFSVSGRAAYQLGLDGLVVLFVNHVVHAVAVDQQVLLITTQTSHLHEYTWENNTRYTPSNEYIFHKSTPMDKS